MTSIKSAHCMFSFASINSNFVICIESPTKHCLFMVPSVDYFQTYIKHFFTRVMIAGAPNRGPSQYKDCLSVYGISILTKRRSYIHKGTPMLVRWRRSIDTPPPLAITVPASALETAPSHQKREHRLGQSWLHVFAINNFEFVFLDRTPFAEMADRSSRKLKSFEGFLVFESLWWNVTTLKRKFHFDEIFITGCTGSCQNDKFQ